MTTADQPLVSVIVCTYNRHDMLQRALGSIFLQDMTDFEVIVVDDGSDPPVELPVHYENRVRLITTKHRGVGAARSEGLHVARGAFVAYCDDDDVWRFNHLGTLVNYLVEHPEVDLVYGDSQWVQGGSQPPPAMSSLDYDIGLLSGHNYIFASDVMHKTSSAREVGGFDPSLQAYEDWDLWLRMSRDHVLRHLPVRIGSRYWHSGCVMATARPQEWEKVCQRQRERLAKARAAGHDDVIMAPSGVVPFERTTWQAQGKKLIWHSVLRPDDSFGHVARQLLWGLERRGVDITLAPARYQAPKDLERFCKPLETWGKLAFYYDYARRPSALRCERVITYAMWESTIVPEETVEDINKAAALLYVPSHQSLDSFQECGVRVPIKVLHHGIDPEQFPYLSRGRREFFTFGTFGNLSPRKGIDVLLRAFTDEFSHEEPARLLVKNTRRGFSAQGPFKIVDSRIKLFSGFLDQKALLEFLRQLDAFVLPSRGEGFGLCGLEAMSTGLPLIATNWSGPAEYLDPEYSLPLSYHLVDAKGTVAHGVRFFGLWAEPDYDHLRFLMRSLYEQPEEARHMGRIAAERVHQKWTWDTAVEQMLADFDAIASE